MENQISISNLKKTNVLKGDEYFVVNQANPVDLKIETRYATLEDLIKHIKSEIKESLDEVMPIGSIKAYTGKVENMDSVPGWLLCNGSKISRIKYKKLYDVIGSLYGSTGPETFTLPDLRGRIIMGYCNGTSPLVPKFGNWDDSKSIILGKNDQSKGTFYHQLNESEMPAHAHPNNHTHQYFNIANMNQTYIGVYSHQGARGNSIVAFAPSELAKKAIEQSKNGNTTFSSDLSAYVGETSEAAGYTSVAGNNEPHNNMQPYVAVNYLIKY
jgi:microcystin-dependent protein